MTETLPLTKFYQAPGVLRSARPGLGIPCAFLTGPILARVLLSQPRGTPHLRQRAYSKNPLPPASPVLVSRPLRSLAVNPQPSAALGGEPDLACCPSPP